MDANQGKSQEAAKLFRRDFTMVVIGQVISLFGNAVLRFALPLYLLRETNSSTLYGTVTACAFVPMVIFYMLGGVIADRVNKRNIMVALDFSTAGVIIGFYLLHGMVPLVPLLMVVLMMLYGIAGAYQPSVQASIPLLVDGEELVRGNAVINMVQTLSSLLGPILGGVLFGAFGIVPILFLSAGCFLASAVLEIFIHIPHEKQERSAGMLTVVRQDLSESWQFIRFRQPELLKGIVLIAFFNMILSSAASVGIPVMIVQFLGLSDASLGLTEAMVGLGGLVGGGLSGIAAHKLRIGGSHWLLLGCAACMAGAGIAMLPGIPVPAAYWLINLMGFLTMVVSAMFNVSILTMVQKITPPQLLGKVMATIMAVCSCAQPVGQAAYGVLFDVMAPVPWLLLFFAGGFGVLLTAVSKPLFQKMELRWSEA
ncbi:MAG: MFS transporter [Firmicutes bacterium]|nr:MFS transporter [Bacillota bacterium]